MKAKLHSLLVICQLTSKLLLCWNSRPLYLVICSLRKHQDKTSTAQLVSRIISRVQVLIPKHALNTNSSYMCSTQALYACAMCPTHASILFLFSSLSCQYLSSKRKAEPSVFSHCKEVLLCCILPEP